MNLQNSFIDQVCQQTALTTIYLVNGHQMKGSIAGYDEQVILLNTDSKQVMIYKHAISTISPAKSMPANDEKGRSQE